MYNCTFKVAGGGGAGTEPDMFSSHVMTEAIVQSTGFQEYRFKKKLLGILDISYVKRLTLVTGAWKLFDRRMMMTLMVIILGTPGSWTFPLEHTKSSSGLCSQEERFLEEVETTVAMDSTDHLPLCT